MNLDSFLESWGWSAFFEKQRNGADADVRLARVINQEKGLYQVQTSVSESLAAQLAGKLNHEIQDPLAYPSVGDWVIYTHTPGDDRALIHQVLERRSCFYRGRDQIVASNIDTVFIVTSANSEMNLNRLDRYLTIAWNSGAQPVIVLSKADLCLDIDSMLAEISRRHLGVDVHAVSVISSQSLAQLDRYLGLGKTVVLLGSSGVGKSTLTNALMGGEITVTGAIREDDERGRHTTTSRQMYRLPGGALLIDTPGMRSLELGDHDDGLDQQFADIVELMSRCRFSDCQHRTEPGCAVLGALSSGELDRDQWESYQKLQREVLFQRMKEDPALRREEVQKWKKRAREGRARAKEKRR